MKNEIMENDAANGMMKKHPAVRLGKIRHLDVQYLWMQGCIRQNQILVEKVKGQENMADILTKYVSSDLMAKHIKSMGIVIPQGRHHLAPEVSK